MNSDSSRQSRPNAPYLYPKHIPSILKALDQWVLWRYDWVESGKGGKWSKVPYSVRGGKAQTNNPATWCSFEKALYRKERGDYDGLGFCFAPGDGLVGIDLDHCIVEGGYGSLEIQAIVERFLPCGYVEITPSGNGVHIWTLGEMARSGKANPPNTGWLEAYDHRSPRYFTVTGQHFAYSLPEPGRGQSGLDWLYETYFHKEVEKSPLVQIAPSTSRVRELPPSDQEVIAYIEAKDPQFSRLYGGDITGHNNDHSSADLALCNKLAFWCDRDGHWMDRLFRASGLMREKWDRVCYSDGRTYGQGAIQKAISGTLTGYTGSFVARVYRDVPSDYLRPVDATLYAEPATAQRNMPQPITETATECHDDREDGDSDDDRDEVINDDIQGATVSQAQDQEEDDQEDDDAWKEDMLFKFNSQGECLGPKSCAANVSLILSNDARFKGHLQYCEFREDIVSTAPPPWNEGKYARVAGPTKVHATWLDDDYMRLICWLQMVYNITITKTLAFDVVAPVAKRNPMHPIRDYLQALVWDGVPRLATWLKTYMGATAQWGDGDKDLDRYLDLAGTYWLISAVARIFQPGCKADHVLILEGETGLGKSTALKTLATIEHNGQTSKWFADTPFAIGTKDSYLGLFGQWIVELAELDSVIRAEDTAAKSFFSSDTDTFRKPYLRKAEQIRRQCVFAGTTNQLEYLRDETGNRRYWPVYCTHIDIAALTRDRAQLWAEAYSLYRGGHQWHPKPEEVSLFQNEQNKRMVEDLWLPLVLEFLYTQPMGTDLSAQEILQGALNIPIDRTGGRKEEMRISKIMAGINWWEKARIYRRGRYVRGYKKTRMEDTL